MRAATRCEKRVDGKVRLRVSTRGDVGWVGINIAAGAQVCVCDKDTDVCASTCHISRPFFGRFTFEVSFVRLSPLSRLGIEFGLFRNTAEKLELRLQVTRDAWVLEKG